MSKFASFLKATLLDPFIRSFFRFTETIICALLFSVLSIINLEIQRAWPFLDGFLPYLWMMLPLLVFKTLLLERLDLKSYWKYLFTGLIIAFIFAFYLLMVIVFPAAAYTTFYGLRMSLAWLIAVLAVLLVNYFPRRENFATYIVYLLTKFFVTIFYAAVLYGGLFGILTSIEGLFSVNLGQYIFIDLLFLIVGLIAVPVFIGFIPSARGEMSDNDYHKIWRTVFSFIIIPIILIFSAILLVYIVTSVFNTRYYPSVYLIASLITAFATIAMIFLLEKYEKDTPHLRFFARVWPIVMLANLAGFAYELIMQIIKDGFDLSTTTYLYLGLAVLFLVIIRVVRKPLKLLGHGQSIGVSLIAASIMVGFMPFINVLNVATYSANARFARMLDEYGMVEDGEIVHADEELSAEQKSVLSSLVISFNDIGFDRIELLPDGFTLDMFESIFGFPCDIGAEETIYLTYSAAGDLIDLSSLEAEGYSHLLFIPQISTLEMVVDAYSYLYDFGTGIWQLEENNLPLAQVDLIDALEYFHAEIGASSADELDWFSDLKYVSPTDDFDIYVTSICGQYEPQEDVYSVTSASFYLGIKA